MTATRVTIHLRISKNVAAEINNPATVPLRWLPFPGVGIPTADLIVGSGQDRLDRHAFRERRDTLGAYIQTNAPETVRRALGLPAGEPGTSVWRRPYPTYYRRALASSRIHSPLDIGGVPVFHQLEIQTR